MVSCTTCVNQMTFFVAVNRLLPWLKCLRLLESWDWLLPLVAVSWTRPFSTVGVSWCFIWIKIHKINLMAPLLFTNIVSSIFFLIFNLTNNYFKRLLELYIWDRVHIWYYPDYNISERFSYCLCNSWCRTPGCYIWPIQRSSGYRCWRRDPFPHSLGAETHHLWLSIPSTQRACHHRQQRYINYCWFDVCTFILIYY